MQIYLCFDIYLNFSTSSFPSNSDYWMLFGLLFKVCYRDAFYASWFQNFVKSIIFSPESCYLKANVLKSYRIWRAEDNQICYTRPLPYF
jgi:hypothetical protein